LWIWSHGRLAKIKKHSWAYVSLGFSFELDPKKHNGVGQYLFVEINAKGLDLFKEKPFTKFPDQTVAQISLRKLLLGLLDDALMGNDVPKQYQKNFVALRKQLS
jgi:hypothetical protein